MKPLNKGSRKHKVEAMSRRGKNDWRYDFGSVYSSSISNRRIPSSHHQQVELGEEREDGDFEEDDQPFMKAGLNTSINAAALQDHFAKALKLDVQMRRLSVVSSKKTKAKCIVPTKEKHQVGMHSKIPYRKKLERRLKRLEAEENLREEQTARQEKEEDEEDSLEKLTRDMLNSNIFRSGLPQVEERQEIQPNKESEASQDAWTCERCTLFNSAGGPTCSACNSNRKSQLKEIEKKRVDNRTLAQKLGLMEGPAAPLSEKQWKKLEKESEKRKDSYEPCTICMQHFGTDEQLMLSCSHVFHKACLESFERFVRSRERCCPLCRKADYEKRVVKLGAKAHRERSAVQVQSWYRGCKARHQFRQILSEYYATGKGDTKLRHKFFARKLNKVSDKLIKSISAQEDSLERLFRDIDSSIRESRRIFDKSAESSVDWPKILEQVKCRGEDTECAICMSSIDLTGATINPDQPAPSTLPSDRKVSILSCSHLFHEQCIQAFETFSIEKQRSCPMCRDNYMCRTTLSYPIP